MQRTSQKCKKEEESKVTSEEDFETVKVSNKSKMPKANKRKKDVSTSNTPVQPKGRTTRNNPKGIAPTKKPSLAKTKPRKLDFKSDEEFEDDGVHIELQDGEGFSSSDEEEDKRSTRSSNRNDNAQTTEDSDFGKSSIYSADDKELHSNKKMGESSKANSSKMLDIVEICCMLLQDDEFQREVMRDRKDKNKKKKRETSDSSDSNSSSKGKEKDVSFGPNRF